MPFLASEGCFWPLTAVMRLLESNIVQPNTTQVTSYEQCKINSNQKFSNTINHAQHFFLIKMPMHLLHSTTETIMN